MKTRITVRNKYRTTAELLAGDSGSLLDVGGRDRVLESYLPKGTFAYASADTEGGHDYIIDLERSLAIPDRAFDVVVALDVLEHVERIHAAFGELARVTGRAMVLALPNMSSWEHRIPFLLTGRLGTDKYELTESSRPDRHRWLTVGGEIERFLDAAGRANGFVPVERVYEMEGRRVGRVVGRVLAALLPGWPRALAARVIYKFERRRNLGADGRAP